MSTAYDLRTQGAFAPIPGPRLVPPPLAPAGDDRAGRAPAGDPVDQVAGTAGQTARGDAAADAKAARRAAQAEARAARAAARAAAHATVPGRIGELAHLTLPALRAYRGQLRDEEDRVSYWRRILQARLDTVGEGQESSDLTTLRRALTSERVGAGRAALVTVVPVDDIPPLPDLATLWATSLTDLVGEERERLLQGLRDAESQLSQYRSALHGRISTATNELIARYHEDPRLCLTALPLAEEELALGA